MKRERLLSSSIADSHESERKMIIEESEAIRKLYIKENKK